MMTNRLAPRNARTRPSSLRLPRPTTDPPAHLTEDPTTTPTAIKPERDAERAEKRVKLEPGLVIQAFEDDDTAELAKLEEDARRQEAEIEQARRIADMMKKNNQMRARIKALKVKRSGNAGAGGDCAVRVC